MWKTKNFITNVVANATDKEFQVIYDIAGFPSSLTFYILNPKFANEELTVSMDELMIKNRLLDKSLYVYIPSNRVTIQKNALYDTRRDDNIICNMHDKNYLVIKLNTLPFLSKLSISDINMIRYEDHGLQCDISSRGIQQSIVTEIDNNKSNYVQLNIQHKSDENIKLWLDFYTYRFKGVTNPENCFNIDVRLGLESIKNSASTNINFNIDRFLFYSNNFSISASGRITNYNIVTGFFREEVNVEISNYTKLIQSLVEQEKNFDSFNELMLSLSEKTANDNIQFTIRHEKNGLSFIGKLSFDDFIKRLSNLSANESNH
ncbi:hypothetical protein [Wolbachia pipientis]|nr:hypothetical protein [Wolbachia pipientis]